MSEAPEQTETQPRLEKSPPSRDYRNNTALKPLGVELRVFSYGASHVVLLKIAVIYNHVEILHTGPQLWRLLSALCTLKCGDLYFGGLHFGICGAQEVPPPLLSLQLSQEWNI